MLPTVVIVSGPPASGKTLLADRLARDLRLPLLTKDRLKEVLFDALGWSDRSWSRKLGGVALDLLYVWAETELAAGRSFITESNFHPDFAGPRFRDLATQYAFTAVQVQCRTDGDLLVARYLARAASTTRHPGHGDRDNFAELEPALRRGLYDDLDIGGLVLHVDTTDFASIPYGALLAAIRAAAPEPAGG